MLYVRVDHHKRYCQLAAVDGRVELVREGRVPTEREELSRFLLIRARILLTGSLARMAQLWQTSVVR